MNGGDAYSHRQLLAYLFQCCVGSGRDNFLETLTMGEEFGGGPVFPFLGSMLPVSRRCFLILEMVERPTRHLSAVARSLMPLSQSSKRHLRISVGKAFILDSFVL
jgi:hypothetical protein